MEKKDLKMYAAPKVELVDLELEGKILTSSPGSEPDDVKDVEWD